MGRGGDGEMGRRGDGEMNIYVVFLSELDNLFLEVPLFFNKNSCIVDL
ncbi:MAG: hypothetical protein F6K58_14970 [Symploca sp. SIO2E9]|nr:hypothetical protein [Symploca sp. SIO2E9]